MSLVYSRGLQPSPLPDFRTFPTSQEVTQYPVAAAPVTPHPQPLPTSHLPSVSMELPLLNISREWNHTRYGHLCLASVTWHTVFKVHPCCRTCQCSGPGYGSVIWRHVGSRKSMDHQGYWGAGGRRGWNRASWHSTKITVLTRSQLFILNESLWYCCKPSVSFQSHERVDFDHFWQWSYCFYWRLDFQRSLPCLKWPVF